MKSSELKKLIKESVKEAIQEELKEILLEAVKTPKVTTVTSLPPQPVMEQQTPQQPAMSVEEKRTAYSNILGDTAAASFKSANVTQTFAPQGAYDSSNGTLPQGEVDMSMIAGLMKK